ncbi:MAG: hypothetical protein KUG81_01680 [Gammaproteobacteria bacterium]|nr:hypothetical protein [Gammaproteobacteria bacterium]
MRNYVSKVLAGIDTANTNALQKDLEALTNRQLIAYDFDTGIEIVAGTKNIGFARGTAILGEPLVAGPIPVSGIIESVLNPYAAPTNKVETLTVTAVPTVGKTAIVKIAYHDNLSIIPNQVKQTTIAVQADAVNAASTTTWAAAIAAEFNKQTAELGGNLFCVVTTSTNTVIFTGITLTTASNYNHIDRPEALNFEVGYPTEAAQGVYSVAVTTPLAIGQGDAAKVAWREEQAMGRFGFSDRRMWNDTKKYPSQVVAGETYDCLVITANSITEGDMQDTHSNPVGAEIYGESDTLALILVDLAVAGITPITVS